MADINNSASDVEYNDDGTKNPDYVAPTTTSEDGAGDDTTKNDTKKDDKDTDKDKDGEDFNDEVDPNKPPEIPTRKSDFQHIIARKNNKIEKLKSKLKEGDEGYVPPNSDSNDDNNDDTTRETVEETVQKTLKPFLDVIISKADEDEINALVKSEPEASKYVNHIKAYMQHDIYKGVPPSVIYHHLAWNKALAIGAKKSKAANLEANQNKGGGRDIVDTNIKDGNFPSAQEIADMSEEEFQKMTNEALQRQ